MIKLKDINENIALGKQEIRIDLKPEAYFMGLNEQSIARQVRQGFYGGQAQRLQEGRDELRVWVRYPKENRLSIGQMEKMKTNFVYQGVAVILGEYGVASRQGVSGFEASRVRWNQYITESAVANDIVPVYWDNGFTGDTGLGLFDRNNGNIVYPDIVNVLVNAR